MADAAPKPPKSEDDETVLICVPASENGSWLVEGSRKDKCGFCGQEVWVSRAGQKFVREGRVDRIMCSPCGDKRTAERPDDPPEVEIPPEVVAEFLNHLRKDRALRN